MLFSIIVPVYNVEKYISRCIQSVLKQDYQDWELILIDDGSKDTSGEICEEYAKSDNRIKVIHQLNSGVSVARNTGLNIATGDYIIFADSDDWLDSNLLANYKSILEADSYDMVACDCYNVQVIGEEEYVEPGNKWRGNGNRLLSEKELFYTVLYCSATLWNKTFKRDIIYGVKFNEKMTFAEDTDFLVSVLFRIKKAWITDYKGYYYFVNRQGNVVSEEINERFIELLKNCKNIYDKLEKCPDNTIGIHRINMVIRQVLKKLPLSSFYKKEYNKYLIECKRTARYPKYTIIFSYLFDKRYDISLRIKYIGFLISIRLTFIIQNIHHIKI